jgi:hypothetical protein
VLYRKEGSVVDQFVGFVGSILALAALGVAFAFVLYLLVRNRLDNVNTLTVMQQDVEAPLPGVPFYVKRGRIVHETSYLETLATLTLSGQQVVLDAQGQVVGEGPPFLGVKTVSLSPDLEKGIASLRDAIQAAKEAKSCSKQLEKWEEAKGVLTALPAYSGALPTHNLPLERNLLAESNYVDYDTVYYLNKLQPISGSSDLDIKLAADGTLSQAVGKTVDSTFEKLLGLVPKADSFVEKKAGEAAADKGEEEVKEALIPPTAAQTCKLEVSLTVEHQYVRHIWFKEVTDRAYQAPFVLPAGFKQEDASAWAGLGYWYRREIVTELEPKAEAPGQKEKEEESD